MSRFGIERCCCNPVTGTACGFCTEPTVSDQFILTIPPGFNSYPSLNSCALGTACSDFPGTYLLERDVPSPGCVWRYESPPHSFSLCTVSDIVMVFNGTGIEIRAQFPTASLGSVFIIWFLSRTTPYSCGFASLTVPFSLDTGHQVCRYDASPLVGPSATIEPV